MAINLVSLVSQFLTPQLVGGLARALGINEAVAQKLAAAAIPAILASLGYGGGCARRRSEGVRRRLEFGSGYLDEAHRRDHAAATLGS